MQDQLVLAVATALATKGSEALITGGGGALGRLYRLLRDRFRSSGVGTSGLDAATDDPDEVDRVELAEKIGRLMAADPDLRTRVEALWRGAAAELAMQSGGVINQFSGVADRVLQARDIGGDASL
ncbi:hypothetical protein ABNF97_30975 [Plantactinospora sp. B6F1]|uniref:hypothetical protein n=1 Tax=Plantactinospora sp. B6F1 TaxID=3158971 RepID=UPI0032D8CE71